MKQTVLTTQQVAEYLQTSKVTIFKMLKEGKLRANKVGKEWRFLRAELDKYLLGETDKNQKNL